MDGFCGKSEHRQFLMMDQPFPKSPAKSGVGKLLIPEGELTVDRQDFLSPHRDGDFPKSPKTGVKKLLIPEGELGNS